MKTHTAPKKFESIQIERRLALGLLSQPQNRNRRKQHPDNGSDFLLTLTAFATLAMFAIPIILFLSK